MGQSSPLLTMAWLPWAMMGAALLILVVVVLLARRKRAPAQPGSERPVAVPMADRMDEESRQDLPAYDRSPSSDVDPADSPRDNIGDEITLILDDATLRDDDLEPSVARLARYRGADFVIKHLSNDLGSRQRSFEIEALLRRAGWNLRGHGVFMGRLPQPVGVIIQYPGETRPDEVDALAEYLQTLGHPVSLEQYPQAPAPTVLIGVDTS